MKTLKLRGFKSFADRTRLEFRPGISVVVGPNGSGKSNLVDAVHWVLGTQAPTSLRTAKMEDVIFAGTATRPALSNAEVTVIFDNGARDLVLDLDEVAITRRLFRDGTSEYEINGVGCRLLDVTELLSDSGVGRHQHIIVNQGQVDSVLAADNEEHRAIIEEAAGVLKHKLRKERAERRLVRTSEDVQRVNDILNEVNRQMRPLKRQAEAATRHAEVQGEVRALTLYLGGEEIRRLDHAIESGTARQDQLQSETESRRKQMTEVDRVESELQTQVRHLTESLDRDSTAAAKLETTLERLRRVAQVAHERRRNALARREGVNERRRDLEEEQANLRAELGDAAVAEREARQNAERLGASLAMIEDQERSLADQAGLSAEGALAVVQGDHRSLTAADDRDRRELEGISARELLIHSQLDSHRQAGEAHAQAVRQLDREVGRASAEYETTARSSRGEQSGWEQASAELQERRVQVAAGAARVEALHVAWERTGDPESRRLVTEARGAIGELTSLLELPSEWVAATEAALGGFAGGVGFGEREALSDAVAALKNAGGGGVPLVSVVASAEVPARDVAEEHGLEVLIDLIEGEQLAGLLGDVVVVEGWNTAWGLVQQHPHIRAVTPEGDLITRHGVRVAEPEGGTIAAAQALLDNAHRDQARAESRVKTLHRQFDQARKAEREALERLEGLELRLASETELMGRARRAANELASELTRLEGRRELLTNAIGERDLALAQLQDSITALAGEESRRQAQLANLAERRRQLVSERETIRSEWQAATRHAAQAAERHSLLVSRLETIESNLSDAPVPYLSEADLSRMAQVEKLARRAIDILGDRVGLLRDRQHGERSAIDGLRSQLDVAISETTRLRADSERSQSELNEIKVRLAEARVRREGVVESLFREVDADEDLALAAPRPQLEGDLPERLASRSAELRRMGPVNPMAAEEFAELSARHEFLSTQLDDLNSSAAELQKVMRALDQEIETRFVAAFSEVAEAYQEYFGVLFPGGQGRMRLTDPSSPITSGVEIEAQPVGKKVSRLSLLSGGERSLAALAFLFAVFKARPSPFYILDEVEAALDDANLRRFLRLVEVFRGQSQVVLITHQQQTMEVADILYGVTLEPGGSSQVISRQHQPA